MKTKMNKQPIVYPSPQDLSYILASCIKKSDLSDFLRKRGIFFFNATQTELARQAAFLLWDADALDQFRAMAYRNSNNKILSGLSLRSPQPFDLSDIYNSLRNSGTLNSKGYKLNSISKITHGGQTHFAGTISYERKSAGRIDFIRTEERDAAFIMKQISATEWQIEVDGAKSNDGKAVVTMLENAIKNHDITMKSMRIDVLTKGETITFFDALAKHGLSDVWEIIDVGRVYIKKDAGTKEESLDEDGQEVFGDDLSGITNAILEGKNLREHEFVKKAEDAGYAFTSMTYSFENRENHARIVIRAEFKGNPKIFEVALEGYDIPTENVNIDYEESKSLMDDQLNMDIRSEFWNNAQRIYYNLNDFK